MEKNIYFVGIGGIGMSAIARHYNAIGLNVAGYDKTPSRLTDEIAAEGIAVSFEDNAETIPADFRNPQDTLVVLTPAIPADNKVLEFFRNGGFNIVKRSVALGRLTNMAKALCVAGTHGKTTTSTLLAHILRSSQVGCSAFLGGISVNYDTNYWANTESKFVVTEADEYDRSFLQLRPTMAVITAMDADHLDIYGTHAEVIRAFRQFASLVAENGLLLLKKGLTIAMSDMAKGLRLQTYALDDNSAACHAENIHVVNGRYEFDVVTPQGSVKNIRLGLPGRHNIENCVAATALALAAGSTPDEVRAACESFRGNRRRFELHVETPRAVVIDDYAHHPEELRATIKSVRELYAGRNLTVCFQPHLYTRTRDLADGFAEVLSLADRALLLDIYPARELPIEGVSSQMLLDKMPTGIGRLSTKETLADDVVSEAFDVVLIVGAGDIDRLVPSIAERVGSTIGI